MAVTITAIFAVFLGGAKTSVTTGSYLASLTMFATSLGYPHVDNVYWTLSYEMGFYFWCFWSTCLGVSGGATGCLVAAAFAILVGLILSPGHWKLQLISFFVGGALLAIVYRRGFLRPHLFLILAICAVAATTFNPILVFGSYAAFILVTVPQIAALNIPLSFTLGALSYPLYLLHCHVGYMVMSHIATPENKYLALTTTIVLIFALTTLVHYLNERWAKGYALAFCEALQRKQSSPALVR